MSKTMNELQIFENPQFGKIRTITEDSKTLFCGKDVAAALGYNEPHKAIARHCKGGTKRPIPTSGGIQEMLFIPEGDIYRLAAKSELPGADKFESWIFDEVLPSIRKTGTYTLSTKQRQLTTDDYMKAAAIVADCRNERLPYVLGFLEQGGFNISRVEPPRDSIPCIQKTSVEFRIRTLEEFF